MPVRLLHRGMGWIDTPDSHGRPGMGVPVGRWKYGVGSCFHGAMYISMVSCTSILESIYLSVSGLLFALID